MGVSRSGHPASAKIDYGRKWFLEMGFWKGDAKKLLLASGYGPKLFLGNILEVVVALQGRRSLAFRQSHFWTILERFWKLCGRFLEGRWAVWSIPLRFLETTETFECPRYLAFWISRPER